MFEINQVPPNRLREIREYECLSQAELGNYSNISVNSIDAAENRRRKLKPLSQQRLVKGLNKNPDKRDKATQYTLKDVFPNG
jgi:DNA-binding transcriptional regulator YiaG